MGNEVSRTAALKRVFQKLDADQQGVLTLDQILSVKKIPGVTHPISNSALLLLRFDESLEGTINFKEFRNLLDHIRNAELKAKGRKKKKRNKLRVWSAVSRDTVTKSELSRNTETPAWTGRKPSSNHDSDSEESDEGSNNSAENDDTLTEDIEETLKVEAKAFFDKMIKSDEGREKFIQWLWRLADTDKNNLVAADELTCVLKALRADGINPENLVYENDNDIKTTDLSKKDQTIAKKLLEEFDKGQTGFLTQEEFTILADLILKNYEIKSEYEVSDLFSRSNRDRAQGSPRSSYKFELDRIDFLFLTFSEISFNCQQIRLSTCT
jgi:Ca2+-binding EF-hand superfamily protein